METAEILSKAIALPKPFVKWVGGKTQLLPELTKRVPESFGRYYEPFIYLMVNPDYNGIIDFGSGTIQGAIRKPDGGIATVNAHGGDHGGANYWISDALQSDAFINEARKLKRSNIPTPEQLSVILGQAKWDFAGFSLEKHLRSTMKKSLNIVCCQHC